MARFADSAHPGANFPYVRHRHRQEHNKRQPTQQTHPLRDGHVAAAVLTIRRGFRTNRSERHPRIHSRARWARAITCSKQRMFFDDGDRFFPRGSARTHHACFLVSLVERLQFSGSEDASHGNQDQNQRGHLHQQFVLLQANAKDKGNERYRNHPRTRPAEKNQVRAKKQGGQPA